MKKQKKYKFSIAVYWTVNADIEVEASNLEEAMKKADEAPLPNDAEFADGSFELCDPEVQEEINQSILEVIKIDDIPEKDLPLHVKDPWKTPEGRKRFEERLKGTV